MKVTFWGTRGSIATSGPETAGFGGDTACVSVTAQDPGHLVVLDAGTGIRRLGSSLPPQVVQIDLLLSHLHLDHIVGLGFFAPLFVAGLSVRIWAPPSTSPLHERLGRYLSPPLFPVRLRDFTCDLELRDASERPVVQGEFTISAAPVIHPDAAVGYRIESHGRSLAYLPDHEPALGPSFPLEREWTSGADIAGDADLLIHDAQYTADEYRDHVGWGHSSIGDAVAFAEIVGAQTLALFHHDPSHDDAQLEILTKEARAGARGVAVLAARQGDTLSLEDAAREGSNGSDTPGFPATRLRGPRTGRSAR